MNAAAVSLIHPPSFTQKAWLRTQLHIGSSQQFSLLSHKMWKTRASTLIRQTLRAELCVIYPLLALWNKFLLFYWNLKEGTENSSSLGVSGLDSSWTQSERIYAVHILMCMCNTHTHTNTPLCLMKNTEHIFWQILILLFPPWYFEWRNSEAVYHLFGLCPFLWDEGKEIYGYVILPQGLFFPFCGVMYCSGLIMYSGIDLQTHHQSLRSGAINLTSRSLSFPICEVAMIILILQNWHEQQM